MKDRRSHAEIETERDHDPYGKPAPYKPGHKNYLQQDDRMIDKHPARNSAIALVLQFVIPVGSLIVALVLFWSHGVNRASILVVAAYNLILVIPWYFSTRDHRSQPGRFETAAAGCWLWFRRITCCGAGMLTVGVVLGHGTRAPFLASAGALVVGLFMVYVGWFGQGNRQFSLDDDLALHRENKNAINGDFNFQKAVEITEKNMATY